MVCFNSITATLQIYFFSTTVFSKVVLLMVQCNLECMNAKITFLILDNFMVKLSCRTQQKKLVIQCRQDIHLQGKSSPKSRKCATQVQISDSSQQLWILFMSHTISNTIVQPRPHGLFSSILWGRQSYNFRP